MTLQESLLNRREEILAAARQHGASNVRVFGSVLRGVPSPNDVDLLVRFDDDRSLLDHVELVQALENILKCRVDVVSEQALHWFIREQILAEAKPL